jgi:DNA-binding CsgD family transcriptional regulator/PAS domain-containing protein
LLVALKPTAHKLRTSNATAQLVAANGGQGMETSTVTRRDQKPAAGTRKLAPLAPADELINLIYRGPLEASPWKSFLKALRDRTNCDYAAIVIRPGRQGAAPIFLTSARVELDEAAGRRIAVDSARLAHLDPLARALAKPGDIFTLDEVTSWDAFVQTEFYDKVIRPYGVRHQLGMLFSEPSGWKCNVGLMNQEGSAAFGEAEKAFFLSFLPHLQTALELYARMRRGESEKRMFEETLDRQTIGAFILDGAGKVVDVNSVGRTLLRSGAGLSIAGGRLTLSRADETARLAQAIRQAVEHREKRPPEPFVDAISATAADGSPLGVLVRAAAPVDRFESDVVPQVIVYVSGSASQQMAPERFVARLFGLTPTEALLATLLSNGLTLTEAAEKLDVTENTVRSYAKKIFAKVGVNRQTELVRLILTSVAHLA